jgi:thiol-disulfide isomerase/thioredoxin
MAKLFAYRVLVAGILSPPAAALLGIFVYSKLTSASTDRDADFVFRLSLTTLAMVLPFAATAALAWADRRRKSLTRSGKIGVGLAVLSLVPAWLPIQGLLGRMDQARNASLRNVAAPVFDTLDLQGNRQRLADHAGEVVVLNAWATWCGPCREEMPKLSRLYQERRGRGLSVFGLSTEEPDVQREFVKERLTVSYPLLTVNGTVPEMYRAIKRYPATFLIDRAGQLQPAPGKDEPFEKLEAAVDALLGAAPSPAPSAAP